MTSLLTSACCCTPGGCDFFCPEITQIDFTGFIQLPQGPTSYPCFPSFPITGVLLREEYLGPGGVVACGWGNWTELGADFSVYNPFPNGSRAACGTTATCPEPLVRVLQAGMGLVLHVVFQAFWPTFGITAAQYCFGTPESDANGCPVNQQNMPIQGSGANVTWDCENDQGFLNAFVVNGFYNLDPLP